MAGKIPTSAGSKIDVVKEKWATIESAAVKSTSALMFVAEGINTCVFADQLSNV